MAKKKGLIIGIITVVVIAGIGLCIKMSGNEKSVETVAQVQIAEEPETETEKEEPVSEDIEPEETASEDTTTIEEDSLQTETMVEAETDEEELEAVADEEDTEVTEMDATMFAIADVNLRRGASVETESLRVVNFAEELKVTGITNGEKQWSRVEDTSKGVGFIASSYLSDTKPEQNTSSQQASSGDTSTSQPSGDTASQSSVQQQYADQLNAALAAMGQTGQSGTYQGQTSQNAMESGLDDGSHHLNQ